MRVLHVTEVLVGGVATYLNALLPQQVAHYGAGNVALLCPEADVKNLDENLRNEILIMTFVKPQRGPRALINLKLKLVSVQKKYSPDCLHLHSSFAGLIGRLGNRCKTIVYTPHGWGFSMRVPWWRRLAYAWVECLLMLNTSKVLAVSEYERNLAKAYRLPVKKITMVYSGLVDRKYIPLHFEQGKLIHLVFVGRSDPEKGLDWLLQCLLDMSRSGFHVQLDVYGASQAPSVGEYSTMSNVNYHGWCAPDEVAQAIENSDGVVVPSLWEAFGYTAVEGMRAGRPVWHSDRGALPEVVGKEQSLYCFSLERPEELASQLKSVNKEGVEFVGEKLRNRYLAMFTVEKMFTSTDFVYKGLDK